MNLEHARRVDTWIGLMICGVLYTWSRVRAWLGGPAQPPMLATTPPPARRTPLHPRRILAMKFYGLGNIIMLLPVLGAVRRAFPDAQIDFLTMAGNAPLLERSDVVDRVIPINTRGYLDLTRSLWRTVGRLRSPGYDLVLDFEQFTKLSTILAFLTGAPERIGFNTDAQRRGWLLTTRVVYTDSDHMSRIFMRILRPLDIDTRPAPVQLRTTAEDMAGVDTLLARGGRTMDRAPLIVVHVGSGPNFYRVPLKRWPLEHFARLCDALIERHNATIVLTGQGEEEANLVRDARHLMEHREDTVNACDQLSITELTALLKRARMTIVNDTSVMHLSAAVRTPVVAFFGPTAPIHYGPNSPESVVFYHDLYCSPCLTNYNLKVSRCDNPVCIRTIRVEDVLERIESEYLADGAADSKPVQIGVSR